MSAGDWKDMYAAAVSGDLALVRHHIGAGVNPNYQHPEILCTPLVASLIHGHHEIAHYLLAHGADPSLVYQITICRMDALALGAAAACLWRLPGWRNRLAGREAWLFALALGVALVGLVATRGYPRLSPAGQVAGYFLASASLALVTLAGASADFGGRNGIVVRGLRSRWLGWLGRHSFCLYVVHKPVSFLICRPLIAHFGVTGFPDPHSAVISLAYTAVCIAISMVIAAISYKFLEQPFLSLKATLAGERSPGPALARGH